MIDPVTIFDPATHLGSVMGIVALTILIVNGLKRSIGNTRRLCMVPTWAYAMLVSGALTWLAHDVLGTLEGELSMLLVSAIGSAVA